MTSVVHPGDSLTRSTRILYVIVLGALVGLGPFTIDLYLPAFPSLTGELGVTEAAIQLTLTATTVGFALGQLVVGPWSDRVGRRLPLLVATGLHVAASVGAALAPEVVSLGAFRVLQGIGAAGGGVVAMAMVRDLFGGRPLVRMLSRLALVTSLAPIVAPLIGSQLLRVVDWRGIFIVLAVYGILVLVVAGFSLGETMPESRAHDAGHSTIGQRYRALFSDKVFIGVAVIGGMQFSGLFSYLSSSPFLFQEVFGLSPQEYGLLFGINSIGILVGNQTASRLTRWVGPQWILAGTTTVHIVSSALIILSVVAGWGFIGVVIPLFFFILACGFAFPCVQVLALAHHGKEAGTAASLLGALNFGLAGVISPVVGALGISNAMSMGAVMLATAVVGTASLWFVVRPKTVPALED
ncbi:multidrug effflux MFS transporter [Herbiconiux sp. L3-i23]|uniref:multidrug effflux MFS transporter n=1 Tax=Herbiconiux sp. L3-i23 TaxID=2905871 RepID=UPI00206EA691|nr:multidrug effflux MFS transporter [Herbiconiux sp. L3-i23]BDI21498.1 Bcr/CflA family drug resistance efflux transporter [Herbiconiux sp. L3-i23]